MQIVWYSVLTALFQKLFTNMQGSMSTSTLNKKIGSLITIFTILLPSLLNIVILCYLYLKNDEKTNDYIENTVSKTIFIGYYPIIVSGFLIKGLVM